MMIIDKDDDDNKISHVKNHNYKNFKNVCEVRRPSLRESSTLSAWTLKVHSMEFCQHCHGLPTTHIHIPFRWLTYTPHHRYTLPGCGKSI